MKRYFGDKALISPHTEAVLIIGAFDGLHLGHRRLIKNAKQDALRRGIPLIGVSFDPDPSELFLQEKAEKRLLSPQDRAKAMLTLGVDAVILFDFSIELAALTPEDFIDSTIYYELKPACIHVGENFRFGARGAGNVRVLAEIGFRDGFDVVAEPLLTENNETVSATRIRSLIAEARIQEANALLGRRHYLRGRVVHGRGEGKGFGFATANIELSHRDCLPAEGVYGGYVVQDGKAWPSAINVGEPRSFGHEKGRAFAEAHLLDFTGDLYGKELAIVFDTWLREGRVFSSLDELKHVVELNISWVQEHLRETSMEVPF